MFNSKQIKELLSNKQVDKCSPKSITYSKKFKLWAVKKYYEDGDSPNMIFREADFNLNIIGKSRPKGCLRLWRKIYNTKGEKELSKENRGSLSRRKPKMKFKNKDEEIKYLKTKIAYIDTENDFLAELRGLKRK